MLPAHHSRASPIPTSSTAMVRQVQRCEVVPHSRKMATSRATTINDTSDTRPMSTLYPMRA
ncbi:hypothetical protein D3C80_2122760 [compost metagenome]